MIKGAYMMWASYQGKLQVDMHTDDACITLFLMIEKTFWQVRQDIKFSRRVIGFVF